MAFVEIFTVRSSSLSGWPDCPRRGAANILRRVVEEMGFKLRRPLSSIAAAIGSGVHASVRVTLEEKAKTGEIAPQSVADDAAVETLRERIRDGVSYDRESQTLNEAEQQAFRMSRAYRTKVAPRINPILVEQRLETRVPWTKNGIILSGQADLVCQEPDAVDDLKTGKQRGNHRPQLGSYSLNVRSHQRANVQKLRETFIPRVGLRHPQPDPQVFEHDLAGSEQAAVAIVRHIDETLTTFLEGDEKRGVLPGDPWAFPANPNSKLCSDKYCSAWGTEFCHEHDKGSLFE